MTLGDDICKIWICDCTIFLIFKRSCVIWMVFISWLLSSEVQWIIKVSLEGFLWNE